MLHVMLAPGPSGPRTALLRELRGRDEMVSWSGGAVAASELLERLMVGKPRGLESVWQLTLSDRDRLIADLYRHYFGEIVEATADCTACDRKFELGFSLVELLDDLSGDATEVSGPDVAGVYALDGVGRFRLPTAGDERDTFGLPADVLRRTLLARCMVEGSGADHAAEIECAMARLSPVLNLDLPASCALCGAAAPVRFDIVSFFLSALWRERVLLEREVHCLARAYRWRHAEIMTLPRSERRAYVALVLGEREAQAGGKR